MPKPPREGYILADSWYSVEKIIKASLKNGFQYVGDLKTNRVIYPKDKSQEGLSKQEIFRLLKIA